jgi:RNA polymerase sigma factor (sigma-70 family)
MIVPVMQTGHPTSDATLVAAALEGCAQSFRQIVERYQALVCSLTYSGTGSLNQSQELAQETFLLAWKNLRQLRDPHKLRSWLCAIARSVVSKNRRRLQREPVPHAPDDLDLDQLADENPTPDNATIRKEEEALLGQALAALPPAYRDPLVLFYREGESVQRVATALELTVETTRQRLSRGRKLLQAQVATLLADTLRRTKPGRAFTAAVMAALLTPVAPGTASAASSSLAAASPANASSTLGAGLTLSAASALLGIFGAYLGLKQSVALARTPRERRFLVTLARMAILFVINLAGAATALLLLGDRLFRTNPALHAGLVVTLLLLHFGFLLGLAAWGRNQLRAMRHTPDPLDASTAAERLNPSISRRIDYRSKWTLLGLPLVHIRFGDYYTREFGLARGWVALGDTAVGVLFAAGWIATGGIALAPVSFGLISHGILAAGALAFGVHAVGLVAAGAVAWGWLGAWGAIALSETCAVGAQAFAPHANDQVAHTFFANGFANVITGLLHHGYLLAALALWPVILAWRETRLLSEEPLASNQPPSAPSPDPSTDPEQDRRRRRLCLLVPLCCLSVVVWFSLLDPEGPRNPNGGYTMSWQAALAFAIALAAFLGSLFTTLALIFPNGYAPGWQLRCPKCGLTVTATQAGLIRVGGFGKNLKPGYCERCRRNRFLILERMPENPTVSSP